MRSRGNFIRQCIWDGLCAWDRVCIGFGGALSIFLCDFCNNFLVDGWILVADVTVDFIAVGEEVHIGRPAVDAHAESGFQIAFGIDSNGNDLGVEGIDELRVAESFLFEHATGGAVITVEVNEDRFPGVRGASHRKVEIFFPLNFFLEVAGQSGREQMRRCQVGACAQCEECQG